MANISSDGMKIDTEYLKNMTFLMNEYGVYSNDVSAISLVGMMAHAATDINDSVLYRSNQAIKESFVITANRMDSLYKHAREVDIHPTFSVPCMIKLVLEIEEYDFMKHATKQGNTYIFNFGTDNFITVGAFIYSFDYPVEIKLEEGVRGEKYLTARYVPDQYNNPISKLSNLTIKAVRQNTSKGYVYHLYFVLQQYHREYTELSFNDRDYGVFNIQTKRSVDQLAGLDIYHIGKSVSNTRANLLNQKMYFESSRTDTDTVFLHYQSANQLKIIHKADIGGFRPVIGDTLMTVLYCTTGSGAEFNFARLQGADIKFRYTDDNPLYMRPILLDGGRSTGGITYGTSKEILRKQIIVKKATRDSIIIENDLSQILSLRNDPNNLNEYAVVKNRNDILKVFNIYTTLNFRHKDRMYTIPTNTLNMDWDYVNDGQEMDGERFYMLNDPYVSSDKAKEGTIRTGTTLSTLGDEHLRYRIPFILAYDKPKNMVRVYDNHINETINTEYNLLNSRVPYSYLCNHVTLTKDDQDSDYVISFELRINLTDSKPQENIFNIIQNPTNPTDPDDTILQDADFMIVNLSLEDADKTELFKSRCKMVAYIVNGDDDYYVYHLKIQDGNDTVIKNDKLRIKDPNTGNYKWVPLEELDAKIEVSSPTGRSAGSNLLDINREVVNRFDFKCTLLKNRTKEFKVQHTNKGNNVIRMNHIPVVALDFYNKHKSLYREALKREYDLEEYLKYYQGEFSYSIKFINSFGYSNTYTTGMNKAQLNNVMLNMSFIVERHMGSTITAEELSKAVYTYISSISFLDYDEFHISNLYDYILNTYPNDVKLIQFKGMNGYTEDHQLISMNTTEIKNDTVIEKLNIPIKYDEDSDEFHFQIKWEFRE